MKSLLSLFIMLFTPALFSGAHADESSLPILCKYGVLTEVYAAQASKFKASGSISAYQKAREKALASGAELGYPDAGVDMMIDGALEDVAKKDSITQRLASLGDSGIVLSPLVEDCLKSPENYIRNYRP